MRQIVSGMVSSEAVGAGFSSVGDRFWPGLGDQNGIPHPERKSAWVGVLGQRTVRTTFEGFDPGSE